MSHNDTEAADAQVPGLASDLGPSVDLADVRLPTDVARGFQTFYGTADPPQTVTTWIEANREAIEILDGRPPTVDNLCSVENGDHSFVAGEGAETQESKAQDYICVLDPLAYPFITDTPGLIKSTTQVREETITIDVRPDEVIVSHPDAVISLGVAADVDGVETVTPEIIYRQICGFIHVFADQDEYETWAADVDAATTSVTVDTGIAIARALAADLFE